MQLVNSPVYEVCSPKSTVDCKAEFLLCLDKREEKIKLLVSVVAFVIKYYGVSLDHIGVIFIVRCYKLEHSTLLVIRMHPM